MFSENYNFKSIESKWQKIWEDSSRLESKQEVRNSNSNPEPKFYSLVMFPYPSGKIHMGHARNYCIGDVVARYKRMNGCRVLHPIGWDAFGLPAENAAIEHAIDPKRWTEQNITDMRHDIKSLGISYDWNCEFATCDPTYYRWNQWFFLQMYKKGLAYRKKSAVNWCPKCQTVLANEQVHENSCWRCKTEVTQKDLDQWFFKITSYAERLLKDLDLLEGKWPKEVILMQKNWIGKSIGAEINFEIVQTPKSEVQNPKSKVQNQEGLEIEHCTSDFKHIKVFTTRPDTLFGCTFLVLSPEHPFINQLIRTGHQSAIEEYCAIAKKRSKIERTSVEREKSGVFTGIDAINPVNNKKIPIWIADYVLSDYGTGAIMAVPAHDQRDFEFAKRYGLPILQVISKKEGTTEDLKNAYENEGILVSSSEFTGMDSEEAKKKISQWLEKKGVGRESVTYRMRDWLISRQRYWGTPIPILYCANCGIVPIEEKSLPVVLPSNIQFTGKGRSPLEQSEDFLKVKCPQCQGDGKRETDTMDTFVDSSWYYLRYCDSKNSDEPFNSNKVNDWVPVDQYIGGIEHACMHLIYSRFFHKVIKDLGLVESEEPFKNLLTQGMVTLGGSAMSKSKGNVVAVEEMVNKYGADTARLFVLFASPPRNQLEWSEDGVQGSWRFLNRVWQMAQKIVQSPKSEVGVLKSEERDSKKELLKKTHQTIKKVGEDIKRDFQFNTAIASLMELLNTLSAYPNLGDKVSKESFGILLRLLFPFAPHITSEIWENLGYESKNMDAVSFPSYDPELVKESTTEIVIQINGKLRGKICLKSVDSQDETKVLSLAKEALVSKGFLLENLAFKNYRFVQGKLVNFVTEQEAEVSK